MKRIDNIVWACREIGQYPNGTVRCDGEKGVVICAEPGDGSAHGFRMDRKLARLLAKRINQCLDDTK